MLPMSEEQAVATSAKFILGDQDQDLSAKQENGAMAFGGLSQSRYGNIGSKGMRSS